MAYRKATRSRSRTSARSRSRTGARRTGYKSRRPVSRTKRAVRSGSRNPAEIRLVIVQDPNAGLAASPAGIAAADKVAPKAKKAKF